MRLLSICLIGSIALSTSGWAQSQDAAAAPISRQLSGLDAGTAATLIDKLTDAQRRLNAGEFQSFELLAGSIASYDQAKISAREAFLRMPFERVWRAERIGSGNTLMQSFALSYAPDGLGHPYWEIDVTIGGSGYIQRVLMTYKPPAPF